MRISRDSMADWQLDANGSRLQALIPPRDYSGINQQDEQLRLWLPHGAKQALAELTERAGISMTVYLTEYFATYFYGYYELQRMRENRTGLYEPVPPVPERRYCAMVVRTPPEPNLGKNIFALKIFVSGKLKLGLQLQADRTGVTLGQFVRSLICAHLFGREYGINDLIGVSMEEKQSADAWERESGGE